MSAKNLKLDTDLGKKNMQIIIDVLPNFITNIEKTPAQYLCGESNPECKTIKNQTETNLTPEFLKTFLIIIQSIDFITTYSEIAIREEIMNGKKQVVGKEILYTEHSVYGDFLLPMIGSVTLSTIISKTDAQNPVVNFYKYIYCFCKFIDISKFIGTGTVLPLTKQSDINHFEFLVKTICNNKVGDNFYLYTKKFFDETRVKDSVKNNVFAILKPLEKLTAFPPTVRFLQLDKTKLKASLNGTSFTRNADIITDNGAKIGKSAEYHFYIAKDIATTQDYFTWMESEDINFFNSLNFSKIHKQLIVKAFVDRYVNSYSYFSSMVSLFSNREYIKGDIKESGSPAKDIDLTKLIVGTEFIHPRYPYDNQSRYQRKNITDYIVLKEVTDLWDNLDKQIKKSNNAKTIAKTMGIFYLKLAWQTPFNTTVNAYTEKDLGIPFVNYIDHCLSTIDTWYQDLEKVIPNISENVEKEITNLVKDFEKLEFKAYAIPKEIIPDQFTFSPTYNIFELIKWDAKQSVFTDIPYDTNIEYNAANKPDYDYFYFNPSRSLATPTPPTITGGYRKNDKKQFGGKSMDLTKFLSPIVTFLTTTGATIAGTPIVLNTLLAYDPMKPTEYAYYPLLKNEYKIDKYLNIKSVAVLNNLTASLPDFAVLNIKMSKAGPATKTVKQYIEPSNTIEKRAFRQTKWIREDDKFVYNGEPKPAPEEKRGCKLFTDKDHCDNFYDNCFDKLDVNNKNSYSIFSSCILKAEQYSNKKDTDIVNDILTMDPKTAMEILNKFGFGYGFVKIPNDRGINYYRVQPVSEWMRDLRNDNLAKEIFGEHYLDVQKAIEESPNEFKKFLSILVEWVNANTSVLNSTYEKGEINEEFYNKYPSVYFMYPHYYGKIATLGDSFYRLEQNLRGGMLGQQNKMLLSNLIGTEDLKMYTLEDSLAYALPYKDLSMYGGYMTESRYMSDIYYSLLGQLKNLANSRLSKKTKDSITKMIDELESDEEKLKEKLNDIMNMNKLFVKSHGRINPYNLDHEKLSQLLEQQKELLDMTDSYNRKKIDIAHTLESINNYLREISEKDTKSKYQRSLEDVFSS